MVICESCQARNADRSAFCIRCGGSLAHAPAHRDPGGDTDAFAAVAGDTPASLVDVAATQLAEGQTQAAIANCRRAIALDPHYVDAHALLGMAYEQGRDLPAALEAYETVLALAPDRTAERQKASLLRLRLDGRSLPEPPEETCPRRTVLGALGDRLRRNPPLTVGITAGVLMFLVLSLVISHAQRAAAARALQMRYQQEVLAGDMAMRNQQYSGAIDHYSAALKLFPTDDNVRTRLQYAYQRAAQANVQAAELPKYIPSPPSENPFAPVPIGGTGPAAPAPAAAASASATTSEHSVAIAPPSPREVFPGPVTPHPASAKSFTGNTVTPIPGRGGTPSGSGPISPVTPPSSPKQPAVAPPPENTAPQPPQGEITITLSDKSPAPTGNSSAGVDPDAIRSRADSLAAAGKIDEAVQAYEQAASAYEARGRQEPATMEASRQAAESCRRRIDVLRAGAKG